MVIKIDKESLFKSINIADSIISSKNINTVIANCLFNISKNSIELISTDNEIAIRTKVDAQADKQMTFAVNGKKFSSILKELPNDELSINVNDSLSINITSKSKEVKGHYTLIGLAADDFPEIPHFVEENSIEIDQGMLKEIIRKVIYAALNDTIKPVFNGIFFISDAKGNMTAVSTDSRRLALISRTVQKDIKFGDGIIIPLKTVNEVYRLLESSGTCRFAYTNNQCFFKIGNTEIISRIVDGQFPNYKQVLPKEHMLEIEVETKKLYDSVKRAMIFTREPANKIIVNISNNKIVIQASTPELGEAEEEIDVKTSKDEKISIGINAQFLIEALKEVDSDNIKCGITGQMSPVTITPANDTSYISIIMPIQIKSSQSD
ncbi:MAG TPA: DNA polymerase III subunit beta [Spirochaetota bacterium]|nr:DNA polymerase III subunit beta [Spirochaetota bacterium]HPC39464.1 DNA polymerase III subunit beta [Spirochaetota bacterium]HPL15872.1 DNA polymerase III subunit beta [Spirochaetota bacterium]HQF06801.1 DNA polymerase III subunit beta [Spirochaetota bacterium]HQH95580.1 DNA polymerase III subunit beta [Spirochaetota bacterium]